MRVFAAAAALAACATTFDYVPINWQQFDNPEARRIDLSFRNDGKRAICFTASYWPDAYGKLDSMGGRVFLNVAEERFSIEEFNTGYCPKGCGRRVAPGEIITGFLPYSDFGLPERLVFEPKVLEFSPQGVECR